jgi:NAD(P)-dependent dehydrogenase (short-subunit alcohol dehydrogenase family)
MKDFSGKVVFITGGASGIGFALADAFGKEGAKVMIAGPNRNTLDAAIGQLADNQIQAQSVICDVSKRSDMQKAALATIAAYGKVHIVCNNAGVGVLGEIGVVETSDWDWVIDVNIKGVIHGTEVFTPLILQHGEGGHIHSTASIAGLLSGPGGEPYSVSKYAVLAMTEGWRQQLADKNIGVSVAFPGPVRTKMNDSYRNRPGGFIRRPISEEREATYAKVNELGQDPAMYAQRVLEGIRNNEQYIITHPESKPRVEARFKAILDAFDTAAQSPALKGHQPIDFAAVAKQTAAEVAAQRAKKA